MTTPEKKLPNGWQWVKLGDVCESIRGVTFKSGEVRNSAKDGFIACVTTRAVQDTIDWTSRSYIPSKAVKNKNRLLEHGDVLVSTANSKALVGKSCQVNNIPEDCTFGAFVTVLRPRNNVLSNWLLLTIKHENARQYFYEMSSNTTNISNLKVSDLLNYEIPLPPLVEQRRIVVALDAQMAVVERARNAAAEILEAVKALSENLPRKFLP